jgi:hypothetical protein
MVELCFCSFEEMPTNNFVESRYVCAKAASGKHASMEQRLAWTLSAIMASAAFASCTIMYMLYYDLSSCLCESKSATCRALCVSGLETSS